MTRTGENPVLAGQNIFDLRIVDHRYFDDLRFLGYTERRRSRVRPQSSQLTDGFHAQEVSTLQPGRCSVDPGP